MLALLGASAALIVSDIPWAGPLGAVRVGRVELTQPATWVKNNFLGGPKGMRVKCAFIT